LEVFLLRIILLFAAIAGATPTDSLRIIQLEGQLKAIEQEKARQEHAADMARVTALENQIKAMASQRPTRLGTEDLFTAGDKIQSSIWFGLAGQVCVALGQANISNGNSNGAAIWLVGGLTLDIISIVKLYGAGSALISASSP